jgi:GNAT superfamily N-acetyltransferase
MPPALQPLMAAAVGRTHWHHYMAWDGDAPAAAAALFIRDGAGWLGVAATLPAYRRRGAQGALMARRLQDGAALGCRWFATETGQDRPDKPNPSFHNMQRAGFIVAYQRPNYLPPPTRA